MLALPKVCMLREGRAGTFNQRLIIRAHKVTENQDSNSGGRGGGQASGVVCVGYIP